MSGSENDDRYPRSKLRTFGAWIALAITLLFLAHACLGTLRQFWPNIPSSLEWLVWVGVGLIGVHVVLAGATTYAMWTDTVRPPSERKKQHQIKKWVTGGILLLAAIFHQLWLGHGIWTQLIMALTAVALCVHLFTSMKSLTRDLGLSKAWRTPARTFVIALTVLICLALLVLVLPVLLG
ncbi:MAG: hypothetical protein IJH83_05105 [Coriobacteriales bacterium]|nr:hypothetical protein [Coriobacteriales bacterium]